jgi:hypothetical protein
MSWVRRKKQPAEIIARDDRSRPALRCYGSVIDLGPVEEKVIVRF